MKDDAGVAKNLKKSYEEMPKERKSTRTCRISEIETNWGKPVIECVPTSYLPRKQTEEYRKVKYGEQGELEWDPRNWADHFLEKLRGLSRVTPNMLPFAQRLMVYEHSRRVNLSLGSATRTRHQMAAELINSDLDRAIDRVERGDVAVCLGDLHADEDHLVETSALLARYQKEPSIESDIVESIENQFNEPTPYPVLSVSGESLSVGPPMEPALSHSSQPVMYSPFQLPMQRHGMDSFESLSNSDILDVESLSDVSTVTDDGHELHEFAEYASHGIFPDPEMTGFNDYSEPFGGPFPVMAHGLESDNEADDMMQHIAMTQDSKPGLPFHANDAGALEERILQLQLWSNDLMAQAVLFPDLGNELIRHADLHIAEAARVHNQLLSLESNGDVTAEFELV